MSFSKAVRSYLHVYSPLELMRLNTKTAYAISICDFFCHRNALDTLRGGGPAMLGCLGLPTELYSQEKLCSHCALQALKVQKVHGILTHFLHICIKTVLRLTYLLEHHFTMSWHSLSMMFKCVRWSLVGGICTMTSDELVSSKWLMVYNRFS